MFAVNTDGTGFTNLHNFTATSGTAGGYGINSDGASPFAKLILSGNTLYGTAQYGGSSGNGAVFAIKTDGTGFTNLYNFTATPGTTGGYGTNRDGANPIGGVILSGNTLYGTTVGGGSSAGGTVFAVNTDGTGFTNLHIFTATNALHINSDGGAPKGGLVLSGNTLYGTAQMGGSSGNGTVFAIRTNGTGFTTLHSFTGIREGANPYAGVIFSGNTLYGTTYSGGTYGDGTVFSLSFTPQLTILPSETNLILTWPTNYAGFDYTAYTLQSTTNLGSSAVWTTNSPVPVVVNGQNVVTNSITGSQQFYRLSQ